MFGSRKNTEGYQFSAPGSSFSNQTKQPRIRLGRLSKNDGGVPTVTGVCACRPTPKAASRLARARLPSMGKPGLRRFCAGNTYHTRRQMVRWGDPVRASATPTRVHEARPWSDLVTNHVVRTVSKVLCLRLLHTSRCCFALPVTVAALRNHTSLQLLLHLACDVCSLWLVRGVDGARIFAGASQRLCPYGGSECEKGIAMHAVRDVQVS